MYFYLYLSVSFSLSVSPSLLYSMNHFFGVSASHLSFNLQELSHSAVTLIFLHVTAGP